MPIKLHHSKHFSVAHEIITIFVRELAKDKNDHEAEYIVRNEFFEKYTFLVLNSEMNEIQQLIQPFIDNFNSTEIIADMFKNFIHAEDKLNSYNKFWFVWNQFKYKVVDETNKGTNNRDLEKVIKSYLFAQTY